MRKYKDRETAALPNNWMKKPGLGIHRTIFALQNSLTSAFAVALTVKKEWLTHPTPLKLDVCVESWLSSYYLQLIELNSPSASDYRKHNL